MQCFPYKSPYIKYKNIFRKYPLTCQQFVILFHGRFVNACTFVSGPLKSYQTSENHTFPWIQFFCWLTLPWFGIFH